MRGKFLTRLLGLLNLRCEDGDLRRHSSLSLAGFSAFGVKRVAVLDNRRVVEVGEVGVEEGNGGDSDAGNRSVLQRGIDLERTRFMAALAHSSGLWADDESLDDPESGECTELKEERRRVLRNDCRFGFGTK